MYVIQFVSLIYSSPITSKFEHVILNLLTTQIPFFCELPFTCSVFLLYYLYFSYWFVSVLLCWILTLSCYICCKYFLPACVLSITLSFVIQKFYILVHSKLSIGTFVDYFFLFSLTWCHKIYFHRFYSKVQKCCFLNLNF